ncbi:hypothetical protein F2P56_013274 [Juglans regia]|uniref:Uncharacterized protein n=1 Tax=Juglans regia TaxID=51240 RepID=A0A833XK26_JUGRE|nr:hypothetical protein F2P56_013274 [Juglans regia]
MATSESTGSFFHDRSTTLGTLMGVSFPAITFRAPSQHWDPQTDKEAKPASLGEFLKVERRFGDGAFFGAAAAELEGVVVLQQQQQQQQQQHQQRNGNRRLLFADGRVHPPATDTTAGALCKFPISLSGICSGGA